MPLTQDALALAMQVVQHIPRALHILAPELRDHAQILAAVCARDPTYVEVLEAGRIVDVLDIVASVKLPLVYKHAQKCDHLKELCSTARAVSTVLQRNTLCFMHVPKVCRDDEELALAAVKSEPRVLRYVSARLRGSKAFVLKIVASEHISPFGCVGRALRGDRALVLKALVTALNPTDVYKEASEALRADRGVLLEAMRRYGTLRYSKICPYACAPAVLKHDTALALEAMAYRAGDVYSNLAPSLRANAEVAMCALDHGMLVHRLSSELLCDRANMCTLIARHGKVLMACHDRVIRNDPVLLKMAARTCGRVLSIVPTELRADRAIVALAVANDGSALRYACETLRSDAEIVRTAVTQDGAAIEWAHPQFLQDLATVVQAAKTAPAAVHRYASEEMLGTPQVLLAMLHAPGVRRTHALGQLKSILGVEMPSVAAAQECSDLAAELAAKIPPDWDDVLEAAEAFVARIYAPGSSVANAHKRAYEEAFG